jgi:hypothetical protein
VSSIVLDQPSARDHFSLDGDPSPGVSKISGGETKDEVVDQKQPLTMGANTVVRSTLNTVTTYELVLWTAADLKKWNQWEAMFLEGRKRRPPRVYTLTDLRFSWSGRVIFEAMTPEEVIKPGGPWRRTLTLHQYVRVAPYGGPLRPQTVDTQVLVATVQRDVAQNLLTAAQAVRAQARAKK